jgi:two-component system, chemotaxis family, response regulator Rcp1
MRERLPDILVVEDNPGDVRLIQEAWKEGGDWCRLFVAENGEEGLAFLRRSGRYTDAPRPALILLDLNMPQKSGIELLAEIKTDENLRRIPIVILTSSRAEHDLLQSYDLHANCYVVKPADLDQFIQCLKAIQTFWFDHVLLPQR